MCTVLRGKILHESAVLTTRSASAGGQGSHVSQTASARCKDVGVTINNVKISGELQSFCTSYFNSHLFDGIFLLSQHANNCPQTLCFRRSGATTNPGTTVFTIDLTVIYK